jgi:hypothetical protein
MRTRCCVAIAAGLFASAVVAVGCDSRRAWTTEDPWYAPAPPDLRSLQWRELPRERVLQVPAQRVADAAAKLNESAAVALDAGTARYLLDGQLVPSTGKPMLVRGLVLNRGTGAFGVAISGDQLAVHHGSLGKHAVPMQKQPLIVFLDETPAKVYVSVSMAE